LGVGVWPPTPNPQSPIPNPQSPMKVNYFIDKIFNLNIIKNNKAIYE